MNILFVCTGNTCRSPMAEAIMKKRVEDHKLDIEVDSAGIFAVEGEDISLNSRLALMELGIDKFEHSAKNIDCKLLKNADIIITMSKGHKVSLLNQADLALGKIYTLKEITIGLEEDIADPFGGNLETYRDTRDEIDNLIDKLIMKFLEK